MEYSPNTRNRTPEKVYERFGSATKKGTWMDLAPSGWTTFEMEIGPSPPRFAIPRGG